MVQALQTGDNALARKAAAPDRPKPPCLYRRGRRRIAPSEPVTRSGASLIRTFYVRGRLWWRRAVHGEVDREAVMARIAEDSGWTPRYAFMILMSAGIAVIGLLVSSPAVVIGAMLISPLMDPILGVGFSLATFDFSETRRSLGALAGGAVLAVAFTWLIVTLSPLKEATAEILSRTRPDLFDLMVALFAALAGAYAIIKGRGGTIVGVAIATALMPPLAVVGYGLATWNVPVLAGSAALFVTNFVTIALAATVMARLYGFGRALSGRQSWIQTILLAAIFVGLAVPLGFSLIRIAHDAVTVTEVRGVLGRQFGPTSRITQLAVDFDAHPLSIRAVVVAPRARAAAPARLRSEIQHELGRPVTLQVDQVLLSPTADSLDAQKAQLQAANGAPAAARGAAAGVREAAAVAAGVDPAAVTLDADRKRADVRATVLPGADLGTYEALEARADAAAPGWTIALVPPLQPLPVIRFQRGSDRLSAAGRAAVLASGWAAKRWNAQSVGVPGLPIAATEPRHPSLAERRARVIAELLRTRGVAAEPTPRAGRAFRLTLTP